MLNITMAKNRLVETGNFSHSELVNVDFQTILDLFIMAGLFDCQTCYFFRHDRCNNTNWYGDEHAANDPPCRGISHSNGI